MFHIIYLGEVLLETESETLANILCIQLRRDGWGRPYVERV